jgi:hypothetical protein
MFDIKPESGENRSQSAGETLQPLPNTRAATQESATGPDPETQRIGSSGMQADLAALPSDWRLVRVGRDKAPIAGTGWFERDNYSPDDALALNGSGPPAWGLKSGPASGVVVLDLDAEGWRESFEEVTGHPITDLPPTIGWTSGKHDRSGHAFQVDPEWWPHLLNHKEQTRPWREGDPLRKNGTKGARTLWELRWDKHQAVIIGAHPETGAYSWLPGCSPQEIPEPALAPDWLLMPLVVQELPNVPRTAPSAADADRAVAMLTCLPPDQFSDYNSWLRVGTALHHTDPGLLNAWVDWSRPMASFDEAECLAKWESFGKGHKGKPATIATLHFLAKQQGYKEPKRKAKQQAQQTKQQAQQAAPDEAPPDTASSLREAPYRILGWSTKLDAVWVQKGNSGIVGSVPLSKAGLQRLAPISYWETLFPGRSGAGWDAAISNVHDAAEALGVFTPDRIRGRGVWLDNDRVVWHLGNRIEVNGQLVHLTELQATAFTYASLPALDINPQVAPLTDAEGIAILDLLHKDMKWDHNGDGLLLAGHTVLGNVCGALEIRPGIQYTGPTQAGKSTTERTIARPLQAGLALRTSGATEAGVRQVMRDDALPVVIDESEEENARQRDGHLHLLRLSFDGQQQVKGTPGGQALTYTMRSMITLIGINAAIPNPADRNRLVVIRPQKLQPDAWTKFQVMRDKLITIEAGRRLVRRTVSNLPALLANIKVFTAVLSSQKGSDRTHQVLGSLLAGAHHLTSTAVLDPDAALTWLDAVGWAGLDDDALEATSADAEARACLDHLLSYSVLWKGSQTGSITVLELLQIVRNTKSDAGDASAALGRLGIKWDRERQLVVANSCKVFAGGKWANGNHRDHLLSLKGAEALASAARFPGWKVSKGVSLPWDVADPPEGT